MRSLSTLPAATQTKGIYYYTTYENHQINAVDMHRENLDTTVLIRYPVLAKQNICFQN